MKKFLSSIFISLLVLTLFSCAQATNLSPREQAEKEINSYANSAKENLVDYNYNSYFFSIDSATHDAIVYLSYCQNNNDYQLVKSWHHCVILLACSSQIKEYATLQKSQLETDNAFYYSQKEYIERQISNANSEYISKVNYLPEYLEVMGMSGLGYEQQILQNYQEERDQKINEYQVQLHYLDVEYAIFLQQMEEIESLISETNGIINQCESEFSKLDIEIKKLEPIVY